MLYERGTVNAMDKLLPDGEGVLLDSYGYEQFSRDVVLQFSALGAELEQFAAELHGQMGILAQAVRRALESGDAQFPLHVCSFLDGILSQPKLISEIANAVAISFVDPQELRETSAGRFTLEGMPDRIRDILLEQERRSGSYN
jgi:hypothetical protein